MNEEQRHAHIESLFHGALEQQSDDREAWIRERETDESFVQEVLELIARDADSRGGLPAEPSSESVHSSQLLEQLSSHRPRESRYRMVGELAAGAQGAILRVWDEDLRRQLAMKVILGQARGSSTGGTPAVAPRTLGRFLEEAQITGQLDHPGIVPVHELGVDDDGRVYFTMRLVKGDNLAAVIRKMEEGADGWTLVRVLGVLQKVFEAISFAHERRVIHRDIKPANIMVGRFGEVYMMDWGLGRLLGEPDTKDVRLRGEPADPTSVIETLAQDEDASDELVTMDGDVVGTPAYMAPEQARGDLTLIGPQADVYSLGATLYHVLTGKMPYAHPVPLPARTVWAILLQQPPLPVATLAPETPPELVAICERAMERTLAARYGSVQELADDLRAFLENRVVQAYRTGPLVELRKWVVRNKGVAAALTALVMVLILAGFTTTLQERARSRVLQRSVDEREVTELAAELASSWPIDPDHAASMEAWMRAVDAISGRLPRYRHDLEALEAELDATDRQEIPELARIPAPIESDQGRHDKFRDYRENELRAQLARAAGQGDADPSELAQLRDDVEIIEEQLPFLQASIDVRRAAWLRQRRWRIADDSAERAYAGQETLVRTLERLLEASAGVEARLAAARDLHRLSIEEHAAEWESALASLRDDGLELVPQLGLVPLRRNPQSGLWEFWHVLSGDAPEIDGNGYDIVEASGIVLVFVPGGTSTMGAPEGDELATNRERPQHDVELAPYFLARHELTIGQWFRLTGESPNEHRPMSSLGSWPCPRVGRTNPVESVSWDDCARALPHWGLDLPTEAQWEWAARAGTQSLYWSGPGFDSLESHVNFADLALARMGFQRAEEVGFDDLHVVHGAVDRFSPNPWGFRSILGNVAEWTRDWSSPMEPYQLDGIAPGTGEHMANEAAWKAVRGGSFRSGPKDLRSSARYSRIPSTRASDLGVRPARMVSPPN